MTNEFLFTSQGKNDECYTPRYGVLPLLEAFAKNLGYDVIKIFREEGLSAKDLKRPVLQKMMKWGYEHAGEFDAVVFWKWERISRGTEEDYVVLGKFFTTCGVKPLSVTECNDETAEWLSNWCKFFSDDVYTSEKYIEFRLSEYKKITKQWLESEEE